MNVSAMFPISLIVNQIEISLVTRSSVILNNSKVRRKLIKKKVLTTKGRTNCAARYLWIINFINTKYAKFTFPSRNGKIR